MLIYSWSSFSKQFLHLIYCQPNSFIFYFYLNMCQPIICIIKNNFTLIFHLSSSSRYKFLLRKVTNFIFLIISKHKIKVQNKFECLFCTLKCEYSSPLYIKSDRGSPASSAPSHCGSCCRISAVPAGSLSSPLYHPDGSLLPYYFRL